MDNEAHTPDDPQHPQHAEYEAACARAAAGSTIDWEAVANGEAPF